jgi:hypothetical protein
MLQALRNLFPSLFPPAPTPSSVEHIVDTDAPPRLPSWLSLRKEGCEHRGMGRVRLTKRNGKLYVNGEEVSIYLSPNQQGDAWIGGHKLRKELAATPGRNLNGNIREYLLSHQELIPDGVRILYFWDTIAADGYGHRCVSRLVPGDGGWHEHWYYLGHVWSSDEPAARLGEQQVA